MADLTTDIRYIKGIGEQRAKALNKLGITTLRDLIGVLEDLVTEAEATP